MTYAATALADSPLFLWLHDEPSGTVATDASPNGRNGTYSGGVTLNQPGQVDGGTAVLLDGSTGKVTNAYNALVVGSQRTFEFWWNRASHSTTDCVFSSNGAGTMLRLESGNQNVNFWPDIGLASTNWTAANPGDNQWVYAVLRFDDAAHRAELLINNVSQGLHTGIEPMAPAAGFVLGNRGAGGANDPFGGLFDAVAVYSGLLSDARVAAHYAAGATGTTGRAKVNIGGVWTKKPVKVNIGGVWTEKPLKRFNGSSWVPLS